MNSIQPERTGEADIIPSSSFMAASRNNSYIQNDSNLSMQNDINIADQDPIMNEKDFSLQQSPFALAYQFMKQKCMVRVILRKKNMYVRVILYKNRNTNEIIACIQYNIYYSFIFSIDNMHLISTINLYFITPF